MGTRSLTYVYDGVRTPANAVLCLYRQMDGYPSGHGQELFEFLDGVEIVNGFSLLPSDNDNKANGMGCLAAQLVAHFKEGIGGFYLQPPKAKADSGQDYEYHIHGGYDEKPQITVTVYDVPYKKPKKQLFNGSVEQFGQFITEYSEE